MKVDNFDELFENSRADPSTPTPRINKKQNEEELNQHFRNYGLLIKLMDYVSEDIPRDQFLSRMQTAYELNLKDTFPDIEDKYFSEEGFLGKYLRENAKISTAQMEEDIGNALYSMALLESVFG